MLFKYNLKEKHFKLLDEINFSSLKIMERQDIEKWVEENPEIIGEAILTITTEYDKFDKTNERLDILGLDKEGKVIVIELKRDDSGKNVELQAIKYAAYCSTLTLKDVVDLRKDYISKKQNKTVSFELIEKEILEFIENGDFEEIDDKPRIILISKEFRPEVTASVLWLRNFQIDISCVKLTPYQINENEIGIISQKIIPLPEAEDYLVKVEKKVGGERGLTLTQQKYIEFWSELKTAFSKNWI